MPNIDITDILKEGRLRPPHFDDATDIWTGADEDTYQAKDQTAGKASLLVAINAIVDGSDATEKQQIKDDIAALVNGEGHITTLINILKSAVFTDAKTELLTAIAAHNEGEYGFGCGRCKEEGRYEAQNDKDEIEGDTTKIPCKSCKQLTRTKVANTAVAVTWSAENTDL